MLRNEDLNAAVKSGVITSEQAAALRQRAASAVPVEPVDSETPRVTRGFNDVMLALGTAIITVALMSQWGLPGTPVLPTVYVTIAVLWLISELLDVRRKAVLPGIVAVIGISLAAAWIGFRFGTQRWDSNVLSGERLALNFSVGVALSMAVAVAFANALYYVRFRLPFALLPLALGVGIACVQAIILVFGWERTAAIPHILGLAFGLLMFAAAMAFDTSDPLELVTRMVNRHTRLLLDHTMSSHDGPTELILSQEFVDAGGTPVTDAGLLRPPAPRSIGGTHHEVLVEPAEVTSLILRLLAEHGLPH